jgi:hypothetical protein
MVVHEANKVVATVNANASRPCGWRSLEAWEREFLARIQGRSSPVGGARAAEKLPHPLDQVVFRMGALTEALGSFDPASSLSSGGG